MSTQSSAEFGGAATAVLATNATLRRRRITAAKVTALCEQLGEDATLRNVQRALGGSFRELGPLVRAWRDAREAGRSTGSEPTQADRHAALAALLRSWLADVSTAIAQRVASLDELISSSPSARIEKRLAEIAARAQAADQAQMKFRDTVRQLESLLSEVKRQLAIRPPLREDRVDLARAIDASIVGMEGRLIEALLAHIRPNGGAGAPDPKRTPNETRPISMDELSDALRHDRLNLSASIDDVGRRVEQIYAQVERFERAPSATAPLEAIAEMLAAIAASDKRRAAAERRLTERCAAIEYAIAGIRDRTLRRERKPAPRKRSNSRPQARPAQRRRSKTTPSGSRRARVSRKKIIAKRRSRTVRTSTPLKPKNASQKRTRGTARARRK